MARCLKTACLGDLLSVWLVFAAPQNPTPTIAEAARQSRERQKAAAGKAVITNDDLRPAKPAADGMATALPEEAIRGEVRSRLSKIFPNELRSHFLFLKQKWETSDGSGNVRAALWYEWPVMAGGEGLLEDMDLLRSTEPFEGRQQWESRLQEAAANLHSELGKALPGIQALLDANQALLEMKSPAGDIYRRMGAIRAQLGEQLLESERWAIQIALLMAEGKLRLRGTWGEAKPR